MLQLAVGQPALPSDENFRVETLASGFVDAMEMAVLPTGDVFIAERTGALKWFKPETGEVALIKQFEVSVKTENLSRETGLLGVTAHPDFMKNGWVYVYYSPKSPEEHRLSRFTFRSGTLGDEKVMLRVSQSREKGVCHEGGSLAFDGQGNLFLSLGDNTNPFKSSGYAPINEMRGMESQNAQRTSGNTNDLRGSVIRIRPTDEGGYTIPSGNLFAKGTRGTRPEIYVKGCRNPWRIGVDQRTGFLYWGEVGPDAKDDSARGPRGYCEINEAREAGYYGWPYFVADNKAYAAYDFKRKKIGELFDAERPENRSKLNTGLKVLPPARVPLWFERRSCYCAGPVYYFDDFGGTEGKLPRELDGCLVTYDWNNGRFQLTKLKESGGYEWKQSWLGKHKFIHPSDAEMGPDGSLYVLEYGSQWYDGTDGALKRVSYSAEKQEVVEDGLDPRLTGLDGEHPGTQLLSAAICLSCHQTQVKSVGPSYVEVAEKYREDENAVVYLTEKILRGGAGVWGEVPMPPHPQFNEEQASQMVEAILTLRSGGHEE
ncbi:MAG: PQQ-dependent sugar dehydrogenase [Verrucomicrobiota bacterium]